MKKTLLFFLFLTVAMVSMAKVPVYVWIHGQNDMEKLRNDFTQWKQHGVVGVCVNCGTDLEKIRACSKLAHEMGLEYHAWVPTMLMGKNFDPSWFTVNRKGQSAFDHPAYVPYYTTLDPYNQEVHKYLKDLFAKIASIPDVDFVQLDYIRYADVILARGLWDKYGLVMNEEYPEADYCYCDLCVNAFKQKTGINIREVKDPSKVKAWAQFRCDAVTDLVNDICQVVHAKGKKMSADVFPGPKSYARWMVRQEWNKWNLDAVFPMNYNDFYLEPAKWVGKVTKEEVKSVKASGMPVYSGLFICHNWERKASIEDPEGSGLLPSEMETAVSGAVKAGAKGICLFTPYSMTDAHWKALDACNQ